MPEDSNSSLYHIEIDLTQADKSVDDLENRLDQFTEHVVQELTKVEQKVASDFSSMGKHLRTALSSVDISSIDSGLESAAQRTRQFESVLVQLIATELAAAQGATAVAKDLLALAKQGDSTAASLFEMIAASGTFSEEQQDVLEQIIGTTVALGNMASELNDAEGDTDQLKENVTELSQALGEQLDYFKQISGVGAGDSAGITAQTDAVEELGQESKKAAQLSLELKDAVSESGDTSAIDQTKDSTEELTESIEELGRKQFEALDAYKEGLRSGVDEEELIQLQEEKQAAFQKFRDAVLESGQDFSLVYGEMSMAMQRAKKETKETTTAVEELAETPAELSLDDSKKSAEELQQELSELAKEYFAVQIAHEKAMSEGDAQGSLETLERRDELLEILERKAKDAGVALHEVLNPTGVNIGYLSEFEEDVDDVADAVARGTTPVIYQKRAVEDTATAYDKLSDSLKEAAQKYVDYSQKVRREEKPATEGDIPEGKKRYESRLFNKVLEEAGGDQKLVAIAIQGSTTAMDALAESAAKAKDETKAVKDAAEEIAPALEKAADKEIPAPKVDKAQVDAMFDNLLEDVEPPKIDLEETIQGEEQAKQKIETVKETVVEAMDETKRAAIDAAKEYLNAQSAVGNIPRSAGRDERIAAIEAVNDAMGEAEKKAKAAGLSLQEAMDLAKTEIASTREVAKSSNIAEAVFEGVEQKAQAATETTVESVKEVEQAAENLGETFDAVKPPKIDAKAVDDMFDNLLGDEKPKIDLGEVVSGDTDAVQKVDNVSQSLDNLEEEAEDVGDAAEEVEDKVLAAARAFVEYNQKLAEQHGAKAVAEGDIPSGQQGYQSRLRNELEKSADGDTQAIQAALNQVQGELVETVGEAEKLNLVLYDLAGVDLTPENPNAPREMIEDMVREGHVLLEKYHELRAAGGSSAYEVKQAYGEALSVLENARKEAEYAGLNFTEILDTVEAEAPGAGTAIEDLSEKIGSLGENVQPEDIVAPIEDAVEQVNDKLGQIASQDVDTPAENLTKDIDAADTNAAELLAKMREASGIEFVPDDIGNNIASYDAWADEVNRATEERRELNQVAQTPPPPPPPPPPVPPTGGGDDPEDPLRRIIELLEQIAQRANDIKSAGGLTLITDEQIQKVQEAMAGMERLAQMRQETASLGAGAATEDQKQASENLRVSAEEVKQASDALNEAANRNSVDIDSTDVSDLKERAEEAFDEIERLNDEVGDTPDPNFDDVADQIRTVDFVTDEAGEAIRTIADLFDYMGEHLTVGARMVVQGLSKAETSSRELGQAFVVLLHDIPEARDELLALANSFNGINIHVDKSGRIIGEFGDGLAQLPRDANAAENTMESFVDRMAQQNNIIGNLLQRYPSLRSGLQMLANMYGDLTARVRGANNELDNTERSANSAVGSNSSLSPFKLGAISGIFQRLTDSVINLAERGFDFLKDKILEALEAAKEFDSIEASFGGIMRGLFGDTGSSEATTQLTAGLQRSLAAAGRRISEDLGADLTDTFRRILPRTGSLDTTSDLLEAAIGLRAAAPDLPAKRGGLAVQEALAGDWQPVRRAFELPVGQIQAAIQAGEDAQGIADALNDTLASLGLAYEQQSDTLIVQVGRIKEELRTLQTVAGINLLEGLEAEMPRIREIMAENEKQFQGVATAAGFALREIVKTGADVFEYLMDAGIVHRIGVIITNIGVFFNRIQAVVEIIGVFGDQFKRVKDEVVDAIKNIAGVWGDMLNRLGFGPVLVMFDNIKQKILEFVGTMEKSHKDVQGVMGGILLAITDAGARIILTFTRWATLGSLIDDVLKGTISASEALEIANEAGLQAYVNTMDEGSAVIEEFNARMYESADAAKATSQSMYEINTAAEELAAALLTVAHSTTTLEELANERNDIVVKLDKELAEEIRRSRLEVEKIEREHANRKLEIEIDFADKRIDMEQKLNDDLYNISLKGSHKRTDATKDVMREYDDIARDTARDFADLETDMTRDAEDAATKRARKIEDIALESSDKRLDIEQKYRDKLMDLQRQYDFDSEEAIRQNDAVALLRLRRKLTKDMEDAKVARDRELRDQRQDADKKREEAQRDYDRDVEDNAIAEERKRQDILTADERKRQDAALEHQRKIQDIYVETQREMTARQLKYDQEFAQLQIEEDRKNDELERQHKFRMEELERQQDERAAAIGRKLDEETELIDQKIDQQKEVMLKAIDTIQQYSVDQLAELGNFSAEAAAQILKDMQALELRINNIARQYQSFRGIGGQIHQGQGPIPPPRRQPGYGGDGESPIRGYAKGGRTPTNEPFMVGEPLAGNKPNVEIMSSGSPYTVTPLTDFLEGMFMRNMLPAQGQGETHVYNKQLQAEIMVNDPTKFTSQQVEQLKGIFGEMLKEAFKGNM